MPSDASGSTSAEETLSPDDTPSSSAFQAGRSRFDLGAPPPPFNAGELPWGYGQDRISALVRSPDSVYLYWEITDPGIDNARRRLGDAGIGGWVNLRVYDTSGREFDGTNANEYFDIGLDRNDRDYFLVLKRPTSSFHFEIGIKTHEGFFQAISRSGRADFPRKSPAPASSLEWMTVTSANAPPAARPYESKYNGPEGSWAPQHSAHAHASGGGHGGGTGESQHVEHSHHEESRTWTWEHPANLEVRWEGPWVFDEWRAEWRSRWLGVAMRAAFADGTFGALSWRVDSFPVTMLDPERVEIRFLGGGPVFLEEMRSGLEVLGPWQVVIKSFETTPERRVLGTWSMHWIRVSPPKVERWWTVFERRRINAYRRERVIGGASEAHMLIEGGASEAWRLGGSERVWLGASEWMAAGGSEVLWLGASQHAFGGASALLYGGSSAWSYGGASERIGGSERVLAGASERMFLGASERHLSDGGTRGSSERWSSAPWLTKDGGLDEHGIGETSAIERES